MPRFALLLACLFFCRNSMTSSISSTSSSSSPSQTRTLAATTARFMHSELIHFETVFSPSFPPIIRQRVLMHLDRWSNSASVNRIQVNGHPSSRPSYTVVLAVGSHACASVLSKRDPLVFHQQLQQLSPGPSDDEDAYQVQTFTSAANQMDIICIRGRRATIGVYDVLERLGFAFIHYRDVFTPSVDHSLRLLSSGDWVRGDGVFSGHWRVRRWHIHTQHPLELTEYLNGMDSDVPWDDMTPEFEALLEWLVANRVESFEFIPLWNHRLIGDVGGVVSLKIERWRLIVEKCRLFGVRVGVDVPISLWQQHSWTLARNYSTGDTFDVDANVRENVDLLLGNVGFDFLSTEIGSTEFTFDSCVHTLDQLNSISDYIWNRYKEDLPVKIHVSQGQRCNNLLDSHGDPLNFNFIPGLANPHVISMPHTVQIPALDSQFVDSYGNRDYGFMHKFIQEQQSNGRQVIWYPETSYWVNYDVDVPLFLPVYILTRIRDARILYQTETDDHRLMGQMVFESGWEWGYWMQNVVAARLSFTKVANGTEREALVDALKVILSPFAEGPYVKGDMESVLVDLIYLQDEYLLQDNSIMGYLVGRDTWSDTTTLIAKSLRTLPGRISLNRAKLDHFKHISTHHLVRLHEFSDELDLIVNRLDAIKPMVYKNSRRYYDEILDSTKLLLQRALFAQAVYHTAMKSYPMHSILLGLPSRDYTNSLSHTSHLLDIAYNIVNERQHSYRTPPSRIAAWRISNPTVYRFTYLWAVKTLHYWKRDLEIVRGGWRTWIPAFMNIIDPFDVGLGLGPLTRWKMIIERLIFDDVSLVNWIGCPKREPLEWFKQ
eukprot:Partr_v1_DN27359_c0_g1_i1_m46484